MNKLRDNKLRDRGLFDQHSIESVKKSLCGIYTYSQIKWGAIKKGEGDIVIVNLKPVTDGLPDIKTYLSHTRFVDRVETVGIFTNVYWSDEYFRLGIKIALATDS